LESSSTLGFAWLVLAALALLASGSGCRATPESPAETALASEADNIDYCALTTDGTRVLAVRPSDHEPPIDDVNWFARPVPNDRGDWLVAFASHDQNFLYDLTHGRRVKIPDRSDAVATPDGRYMTVPSNYTPDAYIRFYDLEPLLQHLDRGDDAHEVAPAFVHEHPDLRKVYYQSTAVVSHNETDNSEATTYRLMFSGTRDEAQFRIVDYDFVRDRSSRKLSVTPSEPMRLCREIPNDLNTPFISKDGKYIVSYTSTSAEPEYTKGSSLKLFRISEIDPKAGTTSCEEVADFGFTAGKADFSFDNSLLTFHISQGGYLTPFINGGLDSPTITDVVVVNLTKDADGNITGFGDLARITTSVREGVGSYFPAFLPDGKLFYIFNAEPKDSDTEKRFRFKVVDPSAELRFASFFSDAESVALASEIGRMWQDACSAESETVLKEHEAPWVLASLGAEQCGALVERTWKPSTFHPKDELLAACDIRRKRF
jgi:hypothetical protein